MWGTALLDAAKSNENPAVIIELVKARADPTARDLTGRRPDIVHRRGIENQHDNGGSAGRGWGSQGHPQAATKWPRGVSLDDPVTEQQDRCASANASYGRASAGAGKHGDSAERQTKTSAKPLVSRAGPADVALADRG